MNTAKLKRFAQDARKKLLEQIAAKLEYVLTADTAELREQAAQVGALKDELGTTSKVALAEKVAYTWFNRLVALRFLDVNGYQPLDLRVISPKDGYTSPELLDEAKEGHVPEDLKVNAQRVYDLLDGRVPSTNPQNEAYRLLLIAACNHLHAVLPFLFERINDYTELLLPDDLTSELSILHDVREGMTAEDCQQVEVIGWLYQFYISEKKDEVFASKAKVKKEDIPAATQLFTPRWIVEYMVQNTVGKLWLQNRPNSSLREHMPYFIESASLQSDDYLKIGSPQELTLLDQACGSGHILVYGFELLARIYEEEGYSPSEIPQLILEHNLFGFEIDERAAQLAAMALMMKARGYQRRLFKKGQVPQPRILCFQDLKLDERQLAATLASLDVKPSDALRHDLGHMRQATNLGSLIVPHTGMAEAGNVLRKIEAKVMQADMYEQHDLLQLKGTLKQLELMGQKYACVVDNPPYMGGGNMNMSLAEFVGRKYPDSKADLMACFMESGLAMLQPRGFLGMINQHSWMFLSSYERLRKAIADTVFIDSLLHLGPRTFPEIGGEVVQNAAFTFWKKIQKSKGTFIRLVEFDTSLIKNKKALEAIADETCGWIFKVHQDTFAKVPGCPIAYWVSDKIVKLFEHNSRVEDLIETREGLATANNDLFLRSWFEVSTSNIYRNCQTVVDAAKSKKRWFPYVKGGSFRRWWGNNDLVVDWENDGLRIKNNIDDKTGRIRSHNYNGEYAFKEGLTWSGLSSSNFAVRHVPAGFKFDAKGPMGFPRNGQDNSAIEYLIGLLNSSLVNTILKALAPTLDFKLGHILNIPLIYSTNEVAVDNISSIVNECILFSKNDWDTRETSFDFTDNELLRIGNESSLDLNECYNSFTHYWSTQYFKLQANEEELNRQFIDIYGLQDELTPDVPLEDITILKQETSIENGQLVFHAQEVMAQFVSYAVGCMFGRYSLDKPGLILANQGETLEDYLRKVGKAEHEVAFLPDADNIIPVLDGDWYGDDITGRFQDFLKVTFGAANLATNLAFVKECLGKDVRKYFLKDFYNDHVQRYKKRPIYWLFSSPQGSFNALIYLHRYTPDTVNTLLNRYLRDYLEKLRTRREHLVRVEVDGTGAEKTQAAKAKDALDKVLLELQDYERNVLYPLATERIALALDHGVLVNYNRFGKALKAVPGLNDAKAQKQVREFDWVQTPTTA